MAQVADGVFQLKIPIPKNTVIPDGSLGYTLVYLIEEGKRLILVDAGWNDDISWKAFLAELAAHHVSATDIGTVVITHFHPDHMGLAARVKEASGAEFVMHVKDASIRREERHRHEETRPPNRELRRLGVSEEDAAHQDPKYERMRGAIPHLEVDRAVNEARTLVPGSDNLWAIWTPGHSPGHLVVHDERRKLLFSGDHILPRISPNVSLSPFVKGDPLADYLASLDQTKKLQADMVLPAHEHAFTDLAGRVDELLEHHRQRLAEAVEAVREGPRTPYQIASKLSWDSKPWPEMSPGTRNMALMEAMAHLRLLINRGVLAREDRDGVLYYRAA